MKLIGMRLSMLLVVLNLNITLTVSLRGLAWRVCFIGLHRAVCQKRLLQNRGLIVRSLHHLESLIDSLRQVMR